MSKFSNFERIDRDFYETIDPKAVPPNFLKYVTGKKYYEPSCGSGKLIEQLEPYSELCGFSDIKPIGKYDYPEAYKDALDLSKEDVIGADCIITNPMYKKEGLLPIIGHCSALLPTWLLLPSDLMHNAYMKPYMAVCERVVSVGRLYFFKNLWVTKEPFGYDELDKKWDKNIEFYDCMKGIKYYTGYLTSDGKPCKTKFVRGTDNYAWYLFIDHETETTFETRGD